MTEQQQQQQAHLSHLVQFETLMTQHNLGLMKRVDLAGRPALVRLERENILKDGSNFQEPEPSTRSSDASSPEQEEGETT